MKTLNLSLIIVILSIALLTPVSASAETPLPTSLPTPPSESTDYPGYAKEIVQGISEGQFAQAMERFRPDILESFPPEKMGEAWGSLIQQMGAFQQITGTTPTQEAGLNIVYVTTEFAKGLIDIQVVFDQAGQVSGFFFTPAGTSLAATHVFQSADYVKPDSFAEQEITVGSDPWDLPGTLTLPKGRGPFPVVVLVHGSGPNDRDETLGPNKPFRDLAEGLASQGIAVLRYDKRTKIYGQQMGETAGNITAKEEVVDDALAAIDLASHTPGIDPQRIYLLGHSLGGMLAPRIAAQAPDLAGVIIMAGPSRPLEDLIVDQVTYLSNLDGSLSSEEQTQIDALKQQATRVKDPTLTPEIPSDQLPLNLPASYWLDLRSTNPAEIASKLDMPLLILSGERDYQVPEADFIGWQTALATKPDAFLKRYPGLNHLFMKGIGKPTPKEYQQPSHVSELVIKDIASFVQNGSINTKVPFIGGIMTTQEITRLVLLLLPIFLIQLGVVIYALVDLARRKKVHGARWLWAVLLVVTTFALPSGLIVAAVYLIWGRKLEESEDGDDDSD